MEEKELIEQAKSGDKIAMTKLVKQYAPTVYNFAFKVCRDKDRAENTVQETFLNMLKSFDSFDGNSKLSTWLYRIVTNNCMMEARKKRPDLYADFDTEESEYEATLPGIDLIPSADLENHELKDALDEAIKKLPYDYRVVFILRDIEELSTEETAQATNLSVAAVKSRLHRARAFLRDELTKRYYK